MDGLGVKIGIGGVDSYRVDTWFRSYFIERNGFNKPPNVVGFYDYNFGVITTPIELNHIVGKKGTHLFLVLD